MTPPATEFATEWIKVPTSSQLTFVGREAVCSGGGSDIIFYSLTNNQQHVYSATGGHYGEGVHCYTGHRQLPVFAFAEKCLKPRILVVTYPEFHLLKTLEEGGAAEGYMALAFSDQDYLVSLSDLPEFNLIVWNWRTEEKLFSNPTEIFNKGQIIRCSFSSPLSIVQFYVRATKFLVWDIHNCHKHCISLRHRLELPSQDPLVDAVWNTEGALFILNLKGCVYMLNTEYKFDLIIDGPGIGYNLPCFTWFKGGLVVVQPNLDIKHFKKVGKWGEDWNICPTKIVQLTASSGKDFLIGWSDCGEILEYDANKTSFVAKINLHSNFIGLCLINPTCNHFATLSKQNEIAVWNALTGEKEGFIKIPDKISVIVSNPEYPYMAAGCFCGKLYLISAYKPDQPSLLTTFNLYKDEISKIVFNGQGTIIVTCNLLFGLFFIIKGMPGQKMNVIAYIDYRRKAVDVCIIEDDRTYKLYILVQHDPCNPVGQKIVMKTISKFNLKVKKKKYVNRKYFYSFITLVDDHFYAKPLYYGNITSLQFTKKNIKIIKECPSGHMMRHIILCSNKNYVYTYGYDGFVIVRNKDLSEVLALISPHHRNDRGVSQVIVDPLLRYVISLGKNKTLVCTKLLGTKIDDRKMKDNARKLVDLSHAFMGRTIGFETENDTTYLEEREKQILKEEEEQNAIERRDIMNDFQMVKREVVQLFEGNINAPGLEKIDVLEFYLHSKLKEYKERLTNEECEWTVRYYKELIRAQDELSSCMKKNFWDKALVQRCIIKGIFANFNVENYTVVPDTITNETYECTMAMREFEETIKSADAFRPWFPAMESVMAMQLERQPAIACKDESTRIKEALETEDSISDIEDVVLENYSSSTTYEFITPCDKLYMQEEIHTYAQLQIDRIIIQWDSNQLRQLMNQKFDDMMQQKTREINTILEKNNRLRYILSELKNDSIFIEDPKWSPTEKPESIITVLPQEVGITPYISPSEQARLDWIAAEEERIRLLLLADDFRERALMKMMDGVLEVRWEDTLKRDIPKPKCMLEKEPENFNEEDLRAIRDYEEKVAFLNSERQRYKNMLEQEYGKIAESIREGIKKVNLRLRDLQLFKIKIESARTHQTLILQRLQVVFLRRFEMNDKQEQFLKDIKVNEEKLQWIQGKITELNDALNECKLAADVLVNKEKLLDKNFRKDFQEYSALIQEQALKLYKKHPKMQIRGVNSVSLLNELGACCVTQEKSLLLTQECLEYLKSVDNLDQYVGVPNTIDETLYKTICRHRRLKLDNELRTKANAIEQSEIENAILAFQKYLSIRKEIGAKLVVDLAQLRQDKLELIHNKELQIVMRQGLVEVKMTGHIKDFDNSILINRKDVEDINAIILKAGERKLKVMQEKMLHRRGILMKEWEHRRMKMQIEDLNDYLYMIRNVKVTKEIQLYLRQKAKGQSLETGMLTLDQEIEQKKKSYEKLIADRFSGIYELEAQIKEYKKKNKAMDQQIAEINVDVCEQQVSRDLEFEQKSKDSTQKRMAAIIKRSKLVKQIQEQHNEILVLQTELELLRLKTYPTLKFKTLF